MKICKIEDCQLKHYGKGYCHGHWSRLAANKPLDNTPIQYRVSRSAHRPCSAIGCVKRFYARGYCEQHYESVKRKERPLYKVWINIKQRCYNKNHPRYKDWGGRGITVCERWLESYDNFASDVGEKPIGKHSIDRINNEGNYEPRNCRWATCKEQNNNQRGII